MGGQSSSDIPLIVPRVSVHQTLSINTREQTMRRRALEASDRGTSTGSRVPDQELKRAFAELQEKMIDTSQKLKFSDVQVESLKRTKQRAELTIKEMANLEPSTRTYKSVGRMFQLDDVRRITEDLESSIKIANEKIKTLQDNKTYLQKSLKESEDNLREMVQQRQGRDASSG